MAIESTVFTKKDAELVVMNLGSKSYMARAAIVRGTASKKLSADDVYKQIVMDVLKEHEETRIKKADREYKFTKAIEAGIEILVPITLVKAIEKDYRAVLYARSIGDTATMLKTPLAWRLVQAWRHNKFNAALCYAKQATIDTLSGFYNE